MVPISWVAEETSVVKKVPEPLKQNVALLGQLILVSGKAEVGSA